MHKLPQHEKVIDAIAKQKHYQRITADAAALRRQLNRISVTCEDLRRQLSLFDVDLFTMGIFMKSDYSDIYNPHIVMIDGVSRRFATKAEAYEYIAEIIARENS